jgi:hypothetical protein
MSVKQENLRTNKEGTKLMQEDQKAKGIMILIEFKDTVVCRILPMKWKKEILMGF